MKVVSLLGQKLVAINFFIASAKDCGTYKNLNSSCWDKLPASRLFLFFSRQRKFFPFANMFAKFKAYGIISCLKMV